MLSEATISKKSSGGGGGVFTARPLPPGQAGLSRLELLVGFRSSTLVKSRAGPINRAPGFFI